jgi:hypothetical protein
VVHQLEQFLLVLVFHELLDAFLEYLLVIIGQDREELGFTLRRDLHINKMVDKGRDPVQASCCVLLYQG